MADPFVVLDHRNLGTGDHEADQFFPAPGNDDVDVFLQLQHLLHGLAGGGGDDLDGVWRDPCFRQTSLEDFGDGQVGVDGLRTSPQDYGVPGLQAKARPRRK